MAGGRFDLDAAAMERLLEEAREQGRESLAGRAPPAAAQPAGLVRAAVPGGVRRDELPGTAAPLRSPVLSDLDHALEAPQLDGGDGEWLSHLGEDPGPREVERAYWQLSGLDHALLRVRRAVFGSWQTGTWLGTDHLGRDLLSHRLGLAYLDPGGPRRDPLLLVIGVFYGSLSGLLGGRLDNLMMRIVDILYSVPFIFVVIFLITLIEDHRETLEQEYGLDREKVFYLVIGAVYWLTMARVVRGQVLSLKRSEFVEAARVMGASTLHILVRHIVPNVLSIVIVYLTLTIPAVMLFEAFLSFLGLGVEPRRSRGA